MADTVHVTGLRELNRGLKRADADTAKILRKRYKDVGDIVRAEAQSRFSRYDAGSAAGFKTRVRQNGIIVEQSKRRVTGLRGDYGALQMRRALLPSLDDKRDDVVRELEQAVEEIADMVGGH